MHSWTFKSCCPRIWATRCCSIEKPKGRLRPLTKVGFELQLLDLGLLHDWVLVIIVIVPTSDIMVSSESLQSRVRYLSPFQPIQISAIQTLNPISFHIWDFSWLTQIIGTLPKNYIKSVMQTFPSPSTTSKYKVNLNAPLKKGIPTNYRPAQCCQRRSCRIAKRLESF